MKIKILGQASGMPDPEMHHASVWVKYDANQVLLDCGEGTAGQLLTNSLAGDVLDAVVITHFHPDHCSGIFMVLQMLYLQKRTKELDIYLPERVDEYNGILEFHYLFRQRFTYKLNLRRIEDVSLKYPSISALPTTHLYSYREVIDRYGLSHVMKSFAIRIQAENKDFIYTSDIAETDFLEPYLPDLDLLIIDALHPEARDVLSIAGRINSRLILNHGISQELKDILNDGKRVLEKAIENEEIVI